MTVTVERRPGGRRASRPTAPGRAPRRRRGRDRLVRPGRRRQRLVVRPRRGSGRPASTAPRPGWRCRRTPRVGDGYRHGVRARGRPRTSRRSLALDELGHGARRRRSTTSWSTAATPRSSRASRERRTPRALGLVEERVVARQLPVGAAGRRSDHWSLRADLGAAVAGLAARAGCSEPACCCAAGLLPAPPAASPPAGRPAGPATAPACGRPGATAGRPGPTASRPGRSARLGVRRRSPPGSTAAGTGPGRRSRASGRGPRPGEADAGAGHRRRRRGRTAAGRRGRRSRAPRAARG